METSWLQVVTAVGTLLSGLGLIGTTAMVFVLVRQTRAAQQANITSAYQAIISTSSAFNGFLLEHPDIYYALRDPDLLIDHFDFDEQMRDRPQVALAVTQQLDWCELVLESMAAFPRGLQLEWQDYIRSMLTRAPYMQRALLDTDWYTEELRALAVPA